MNPVKELKDIVSRLEALTSGASTQQGQGQSSTGVSYPPFTEFDLANKEFIESSTHTTEQALKDITVIIEKSFTQMKSILEYSFHAKKPDDVTVKAIQKLLKQTMDPIAKFSSNQTVQPHTKVILEGLNAVFWVISDVPKMVIEGAIEPAEYMLAKVRLQKVAENTKWCDNFIKVLKKLLEYQGKNFQMGLNWNFKGTQTLEELTQILKNGPAKTASAPPPPPPPPHGPPPPPPPAQLAPQSDHQDDRAALFAMLNQGEGITKMLKKVDKEALKKQKEEQGEPLQQKQQVQKQTQKAEPTVKQPKRFFKENWFIENYVNESLIEFKEDEAEMKQSLFFENCNNCGIIIKPKVKSIFLSGCSKIQLVFESVVSGVELVGCQRVEIICLNICPSFQLDNSQSIHLTLNGSKDIEILSAKSNDFNITYLKEDGDLAKDTNIPEQFHTVWDKELGKFVTKVHDANFG